MGIVTLTVSQKTFATLLANVAQMHQMKMDLLYRSETKQN